MRFKLRCDLGRLSDLTVGNVRIVSIKAPPPKHSLLVVRTPSGVRGYWNVCRHLPIPLDCGAGSLPATDDLVCQTHGARYRPEDGFCTTGPCEGTWLESIPLEIDEAADRIFGSIELEVDDETKSS